MALTLKTTRDIDQVTDAQLVADGDKGTTYWFRHLTIEKHREIVRKNTGKVPDKRTHQKIDKVDWDKVSDDLYAYVLVKWDGVLFDGKAVGIDDDVTYEDPNTQESITCAAKDLIDGTRRTALLEKAGLNEVEAAPERRAESFRAPANVR